MNGLAYRVWNGLYTCELERMGAEMETRVLQGGVSQVWEKSWTWTWVCRGRKVWAWCGRAGLHKANKGSRCGKKRLKSKEGGGGGENISNAYV